MKINSYLYLLFIFFLILNGYSQEPNNSKSNNIVTPYRLPPPDEGGDDWWWLTRDYDNDGFGAPGNPRIQSSKPTWPGYAPNEDDCNDGDAIPP